MPTKTPTAQGISRLLAKAGFERAEYTGGRYGHRNRSEGFVVRAEDGGVSVRHVFGSHRTDEQRGRGRQLLNQYADAITAAGWTVNRGLWRLLVTAGED